MDTAEEAALRATRDKALADRQRLDVVIAYLSEQLGEAVPNGAEGATPGAPARGGSDPVAGTTEGEYYGFTSTDAALEIMKKFGSRQAPMKTKAIYDAVKKGSVDISSEESLYRSLSRSKRFKKVGRGLWGLSEWYPDHKKKPEGNGSEDESDDVDPVDDDTGASEQSAEDDAPAHNWDDEEPF